MRQALSLLLIPCFLAAQEPVNLSVINRIRTEAMKNSQVMETAFYLTDVHGPRLSGSPQIKRAGDWAVAQLKTWGITNPHMEVWGPFGKGWQNLKFSGHLKSPEYAPLIGFARPWSPGTNGPVSGEPVLAPIRTEADLAKWKGKLKGKIVLLNEPRALGPQANALLHRYDDAELAKLSLAPDPVAAPRFDANSRRRLRNTINKFLVDEGVVLTIVPSFRRDNSPTPDLNLLADGGTIFGTQAGSPNPEDPVPPPAAAIATEHYDRIARLLEHKVPVTVEFDIQSQFVDEPQNSFTVVGEIPGGAKKDEIVMIGAHLDSWSFGTGATDNAAGSAVMMEVMRILKTLDLKMDRTVRIGLWSGEEQGILGSRAYVNEHFANRDDMKLKAEHAKLSGYFNYDNGTGRVRGVYLQGNDMMRPVFQSWFEPFKDMGVTTITIRDTGGTDHLSFDAVGLPGFQFIQDSVEYETRTHHSNMDVYDRLQAADLQQSAAVIASVVYHAATRPEMLPRKPLPKPQPARTGNGGGPRATE